MEFDKCEKMNQQEKLSEEFILKEEMVSYLKSGINLLNGNLYLTPERLILNAHKIGVGGFGLLGAVLNQKVKKKRYGFNLKFSEITKIEQGKHGLQNNVLKVTDRQNNTYRIMVKNYHEWEKELSKYINN